MTRCNDGHFYDAAKHHACPWCPKPVELAPDNIPGGKTVPLRPLDEPAPAPPPQPPGVQAFAPAGKTVPLMRGSGKIEPVVGWLVCLEGPDRGQDFRLRSEKNFIGRSAAMEVCLAGDDGVSRDKHATLTFEPKKQNFWLVPGESSGLVYLNGDVVHAAQQLKAGDSIEVGRSRLVLVPFAHEGFRWDA